MRKKLKKVLYILDITAECVMISIEANKKFGDWMWFIKGWYRNKNERWK